MAKIQINPLSSVNNLDTAINLRFQQIEDTFNENILWRDGFIGEPNQMEVDLDMNENSILNLLELQLGDTSVKADILQNASDIVDLQDAVAFLWPDGDTPYPITTFKWGTISGPITDQADLYSYLNNYENRITANESWITTHSGEYTALEIRVGVNETDIGTNATDILSNAGAITTLAGRVTTNEGDITTLAGRVTTNEGDITTNATAISTETTNRTNADLAVAAAAEDLSIAYAIALGG